jgi:hypothetical protein
MNDIPLLNFFFVGLKVLRLHVSQITVRKSGLGGGAGTAEIGD